MKTLLKPILCATVLAAATTASHAQIIFRETFSNTSVNPALGNSSIVTGWTVYGADNGDSLKVKSIDDYAKLSNSNGRPTDVDNVNSGNNTTSQTVTGYAFVDNGKKALVFRDISALSLDKSELTSIDWWMFNGVTAVEQRIALKIGSEWYVSGAFTGTVSGGGGSFGASAEQMTINSATIAGANWFDLDFTLGSPDFTIGTSALSLPTGDIEKFGVYTPSNGGNSRFDTLTISAVPEPATWALMATSLTGVMVLRRRRR